MGARINLSCLSLLGFTFMFGIIKSEVDLEKHLQPDDIGDRYYFSPQNDEYACTRKCIEGEPPRICYYKFTIEDYAVLSNACGNCPENVTDCYKPQCISTDGYRKGFPSINRRLPGPSIQVCKGDRIIVDVRNSMADKATSFHWHGIEQRGTPFSDGAPMITQCSILPGTSFRYDFIAEKAGTFIYHTHLGLHKVDMTTGSLIVRSPEESERYKNLYNYDLPAHVIFISDWYHTNPEDRFPGLTKTDPLLHASYLLINGRGRYKDSQGNMSLTPYTVYEVEQGNTYRFRAIGGGTSICPTKLCIEGHTLTVLTSDGNAFQPISVDCILITTGERFDFLLNTTEATLTRNVNSYWIKVIGGSTCAKEEVYQLAILKYKDSKQELPETIIKDYAELDTEGQVTILNPEKAECDGIFSICLDSMVTTEHFDQRILSSEVDKTITLKMGAYYPSLEELFYTGKFTRYILDPKKLPVKSVINNITQSTPHSPLLSQWSDIPENSFCEKGPNGDPVCNAVHCNCLHLYKVALHSLVEFILIGNIDDHPFHLHGFSFSVMSIGKLNQSVTEDNLTELVKKKQISSSTTPILKDTINLPGSGYTVLRIIADNPGFWLFHCHINSHNQAGMNVILQVGEIDEMPKAPNGFPKCGDYLPTVN